MIVTKGYGSGLIVTQGYGWESISPPFIIRPALCAFICKVRDFLRLAKDRL